MKQSEISDVTKIVSIAKFPRKSAILRIRARSALNDPARGYMLKVNRLV